MALALDQSTAMRNLLVQHGRIVHAEALLRGWLMAGPNPELEELQYRIESARKLVEDQLEQLIDETRDAADLIDAMLADLGVD